MSKINPQHRILVSAYSIKANPIFSGVLMWCLPFDGDGLAQMKSELARRPTWNNGHSIFGGVIGRDVIGNSTEPIVISLPNGPRQVGSGRSGTYVITSFSLD